MTGDLDLRARAHMKSGSGFQGWESSAAAKSLVFCCGTCNLLCARWPDVLLAGTVGLETVPCQGPRSFESQRSKFNGTGSARTIGFEVPVCRPCFRNLSYSLASPALRTAIDSL